MRLAANAACVVFYDTRQAFACMHALKRQLVRDQYLVTWFGDSSILNPHDKDLIENQGEILVSGFQGSQERLWKMGEAVGDVRSIKEFDTPQGRDLVLEYHDTRVAEVALMKLNGFVYEVCPALGCPPTDTNEI